MAATMRTSTHCVVMPPTGSNMPFSSTRSSLTCSFGLMSPISSRKIVPPSASRKRPTREQIAPVNAPRSWPNISLSRRSSGIAPQCTGTSRCNRRRLRAWIACATSSLPVPLSPVTSTVAFVPATRRTMSNTACMLRCRPMMPANPGLPDSTSSTVAGVASEAATTTSSVVSVSGLTNSNALIVPSLAPLMRCRATEQARCQKLEQLP